MTINYKDDNVMHANVWFEFFVGLLKCQKFKTHDIPGGAVY